MDTFAHRLRVLTGSVSWNNLALLLGVPRTTIRCWFDGKSLPTLNRLPHLAERLGVNPAWLAWGVGPRDDSQKKETES
jgi:hypothetical protein